MKYKVTKPSKEKVIKAKVAEKMIDAGKKGKGYEAPKKKK